MMGIEEQLARLARARGMMESELELLMAEPNPDRLEELGLRSLIESVERLSRLALERSN